MHIAVFVKRTTFHNGYGGLETQNKVLVEGLASRKHSVVVFSPKGDVKADELEENIVSYVFIDSIYRMGIFFQSFEEKLSALLKKIFPNLNTSGVFSSKGKEDWLVKSYAYFSKYNEEKKFDIIICQSAIGLGLIRAREEHKIPIVSISHGTILGEYKSRLKSISGISAFLSPKYLLTFIRDSVYVLVNYFTRQREFVHGSDVVITVSKAVKDKLIEETFANPKKFKVIYNGISPPKRSSKDIPQIPRNNPPTILYLGRVIRSKGVFNLADALSKIAPTKWNLTIVGEGEDLEELKRYCEKLGIATNIEFIGQVPHKDAMDLMLRADIFVLPSTRVEGFPMVLVEAMFSGLPVIASDIGGNADAVVDGTEELDDSTGFLVEAGNVLELQKKLYELLIDSRLASIMSKNARIRAENNFTVEIMLDKYEKVFEELKSENTKN